MKRIIVALFTLILEIFCTVAAEEIHFDNETYKLKFSTIAANTKGYGNEYFRNNENVSKWTKMIGIYSYPKIDNPIKFAQDFDKTIEQTNNSLILKMIENKNANKAIISLLINGSENKNKFFEYDVYKFEKLKSGGMIVSKYASKHYFNNDNEIKKIAENIKKDNDKYLELFAISQTPTIVQKDLFPTNN